MINISPNHETLKCVALERPETQKAGATLGFWSFLFFLSGAFDIGIGLLVWTRVIPINPTNIPVFLLCFLVGVIYLMLGLICQMRQADGKSSR